MRLAGFYFAIILGTVLTQAQQIKIDLTERMEDDKIQKSLAILPVYRFESDSIEPYTLFGVDKEELGGQQEPLVIRKFPDLDYTNDTGYTYIYFSGANNDINQGYCLTLIGNYRRSTRTVYFYVDRNNNLDFTDDGPVDSLPYALNTIEIKLRNLTNANATHQLRLTRMKYGENYNYRKLLDEHFKKHSGNKKFTSINYCYREQRLNTIGARFKSETDSFTIALKDMNNDGLFNESCMDRLYIGGYHDVIHTEEMALQLPRNEDNYFEWNQKRYRLVNIDPAGNYITVEVMEGEELTKQLQMGKKIPDFSFVNINNEKEEIKDYEKKPVYIFFWNEENLSEEDTSYLNKLRMEYADQVSIITLNHGGNHRNVRKFHYYERISWPIGFSSYKLGKLFYLEAIPRGFYLKKRLKLENDNITPKKLYEMYKEKY